MRTPGNVYTSVNLCCAAVADAVAARSAAVVQVAQSYNDVRKYATRTQHEWRERNARHQSCRELRAVRGKTRNAFTLKYETHRQSYMQPQK